MRGKEMFNKKTGSILSGPRLLIATMIASVSFILSVEGALAVYKYDNEEKDTHLWLVGIAEGEAEYLTLEGTGVSPKFLEGGNLERQRQLRHSTNG